MSLVTRDLLVNVMPECAKVVDSFVEPMNEAFPVFHIDNPVRVAAFLAHAGHESVRLTTLVENLNYSVKGLLRVFPHYFTVEQAREYAHKPMKIASRVYAGRMGNRDEASGDGWTYRGRGIFQLTGASNYRRAGEALVGDPNYFLNEPDKAAEPLWAVRTATWFWSANGLNQYADIEDEASFKRLTRRINGGLHGLQDRLDLWRKFREELKLA